MKNLDLIFVHVPKCGGTSINEALRQRFGDGLYVDHDAPADPTAQMNIDPDGFLHRVYAGNYEYLDRARAVTGHIWIRKYDKITTALRAVILRHPVDRAISNYFYWLKIGRPDHPLRSHIISQQLDIVGFCRLPVMRWFYTRHMFRDTDMAIFDYIGDHSTLRDDWHGAMSRLSLDHPPLHNNKTRDVQPDYASRYDELVQDPKIMTVLRDLLVDDIEFYERSLARS